LVLGGAIDQCLLTMSGGVADSDRDNPELHGEHRS
jgi:hypothetical protein